MKRILLFLGLFLLTTLGIVPEGLYAQTQCATADEVSYPFDTDVFTLVQRYASPSPRHHGRYHTGEDWAGERGNTLGTPVRAIANGRVTYSFPLGWGRDGGVVIIEHTFADGSVLYSQYGHMTESETVKFPMRLTCVSAGDVIGVVADARPAPHVHFEIRVRGGDTPGPGYSWEYPDDLGWRHPSRFIQNYNAARQSSYRWDLETVSLSGFTSPPLLLNDRSLLYIDGAILRLATYDGRVLWRKLLSKPAVAVAGISGSAHLIFADGEVHRIDGEGTTQETWSIPLDEGETLRTPPHTGGVSLSNDASILFYTSAGDVVRVSPDLRGLVWRVAVPARPVDALSTDALTAIRTRADDLIIISDEGEVLDEAKLRGSAALAAGADGELMVLSRGGLWGVDASGTWRLLHEDLRASDNAAARVSPALARTAARTEARILAYDGTTLSLLDERYTVLGGFGLTLSGQVRSYVLDDKIAFLSDSGELIVVDSDLNVCGGFAMFGGSGALTWANLALEGAPEGVLRVLVDTAVFGLDWQRFTAGCEQP